MRYYHNRGVVGLFTFAIYIRRRQLLLLRVWPLTHSMIAQCPYHTSRCQLHTSIHSLHTRPACLTLLNKQHNEYKLYLCASLTPAIQLKTTNTYATHAAIQYVACGIHAIIPLFPYQNLRICHTQYQAALHFVPPTYILVTWCRAALAIHNSSCTCTQLLSHSQMQT